ncbi:hypothetical protein B0J12DRAFT_245885 [Macrophomina phaseolina]|uniref:Uncharacterized protein n=1 Tax=Macrophomina phaseolina TaxID=35725 RepID=A0ABQ8G0N1_9PEZI|nr:hypothetical protein B0J12DRAFT_245885 [Macrophomina phaseolina]
MRIWEAIRERSTGAKLASRTYVRDATGSSGVGLEKSEAGLRLVCRVVRCAARACSSLRRRPRGSGCGLQRQPEIGKLCAMFICAPGPLSVNPSSRSDDLAPKATTTDDDDTANDNDSNSALLPTQRLSHALRGTKALELSQVRATPHLTK